MATRLTTIGNSYVVVTWEPTIIVDRALDSPKFIDWTRTIEQNGNIIVEAIHIQSLDYFGKRVGILKMLVTARLSHNQIPLPGIVILKGGGVSVLVVLECEGVEYVVTCVQPRLPLGDDGFTELPAGLLDDQDDFAGACARELEEEAGISIKKHDLLDMTQEIYGRDTKGVYMLPGSNDTFIRLFLYRKSVNKDYIDKLQNKITGLISEGEQIMLRVNRLSDLPRLCNDGKTLSALALYREIRGESRSGRDISPEALEKIPLVMAIQDLQLKGFGAREHVSLSTSMERLHLVLTSLSRERDEAIPKMERCLAAGIATLLRDLGEVKGKSTKASE